ncbi:M20 family metallopeptidase [Candidatus Amarolinea dominans]|uniref:M20 family metallopeptidase n=1 Tax=Candidatus Amarolinea dominans TaxID=3140696 RepID=UPI0031359416|nr:M20 family metallopeptidase [Anaerolineae bacterium]
MRQLLEHIAANQDLLIRDLLAWCALESPSNDPAATTRMAQMAAAHLAAAGAAVEIIPGQVNGSMVQATWAGGDGKPLLLLAHHDTVHPIGSLARNPPRVEDGRVYGPGSYDMKGGALLAAAALAAIRSLGRPLPRPVILLSTADEELSSTDSRPLIEALARQAEAVLVLEPAFYGGELKTARKGVGTFTIRALGRASHAGGAHELGINAIVELAHQVRTLTDLTDYERGITISVGLIQGGSAVNTVPAAAEMQVDARVWRLEDAAWVNQQVYALRPHLPGASLQISGGVDRPPMERLPGTVRLFELARRLGQEIGLELVERAVGGASDGNFTAALGIPTLDGLGVCGDGAHTDEEYVLIGQLAPRAAVLAGLLLNV